MATELSTQLAHIRARSTNSLDLKAQRRAHSQSLLFDTDVAATQDFDTIYQICIQGFEDLCRLDTRYSVFSQSLFSEQSKHEDRTQLTKAQNEQLDIALESFLNLTGVRILLKPTLKAIEWLIRRFRSVDHMLYLKRPILTITYRVHELNTQSLILTFLPYHNAPIFGTMLSILPQDIPSAFKFLYPQKQKCACPPRHTIAHAALNSGSFLSALSLHVLDNCRMGTQYPALVSFWASIMTELIPGMRDKFQSARLDAQRHSQEDAILFLLPIVNEALAIRNVPELRIATYMILTVLASQFHFEDSILTMLMSAVVSGWTKSSHSGLICITVLAERMHETKLPNRVAKALLRLETIEDDLLILSKQYRVDGLVLGLIRNIIRRLHRNYDQKEHCMLRRLFETQLMDSQVSILAIKSLLNSTRETVSASSTSYDAQRFLLDLCIYLVDTPHIGHQIQALLKEEGAGTVQRRLQGLIQDGDDRMDESLGAAEMKNGQNDPGHRDLAALTLEIPTRTAFETSFLSHADSFIFASLEKAFTNLSNSQGLQKQFSALPVLRKSLAMTEPLFLSFYVRVWCGTSPAEVRAAAIREVLETIKSERCTADIQFLLPYILYALSDSSQSIRKAASDLVLILGSVYSEQNSNVERGVSLGILGQDNIYDRIKTSGAVSWLLLKDVCRFLEEILVPDLEECLLDPSHGSRLLVGSLKGLKHGMANHVIHRELKTSLRLSIFTCLCSHTVHTPLYAVKLHLLKILNQVDKVVTVSRTKLLLPVLSSALEMKEEAFVGACRKESISVSELWQALLNVVTPIDQDGVLILKSIIEDQMIAECSDTAHHRIRTIWLHLKPELQSNIADSLFQLSMSTSQSDRKHLAGMKALNTLTLLPLSSSVLSSFLERLPKLSDEIGVSKKRRSKQDLNKEANAKPAPDLGTQIRQITLVLELVESSSAERQPKMLRGLFQLLADLQRSQDKIKGGINYLQVLTLDSILAIITGAENGPDSSIDPSEINADVIIECIQTTSSTQTRNTGLLLISALARVRSELILHNVMPIFTFMGSNMLSQADEFSNHVISQTMDSIIPQLMQSLHKRKSSQLSGVSELLLSFAAAFEDLPAHRRMEIYGSLIEKVGSEPYLYAFVAILIYENPKNKRVMQFASDLVCQYDVEIQLIVVRQYLDLLLDNLQKKPTTSAQVLAIDAKPSRMDVMANLLPFVPVMLSTGSIVNKTRKELALGGEKSSSIKAQYELSLETLFFISQDHNNTPQTHTLCMQALDDLLALLPMAHLIDAFEKLLLRTQDDIRRQIILSFESRLEDKLDLQTAGKSCLQLLPRLTLILQETPDPSLKQTAISSMDKVIEIFGKKGVEAVLECGRVIASGTCFAAAESSIRMASLLCLATIVETAGDAFMPLIPTAFPIALEQLEQSMAIATEDTRLHNAAYSFLSCSLLYVPQMMVGPFLDRLLTASHESANSALGDESDKCRNETLSLIGTNVNVKESFVSLDRTWTSAMTEGPIAVKEHMKVLSSSIEHQPKGLVLKQADILGRLFLKAFDLRRIQLSPRTGESYEDVEVDEAENAISDAAMVMVYKLNDATFRPFFTQAVEWASSTLSNEKGVMFRRTTWYAFLLKFFENLKVSESNPNPEIRQAKALQQSIVTSYATFITEDAQDILSNVSPSDKDAMLLWQRVIRTLQKTFEYDQDGTRQQLYAPIMPLTCYNRVLSLPFPFHAHLRCIAQPAVPCADHSNPAWCYSSIGGISGRHGFLYPIQGNERGHS